MKVPPYMMHALRSPTNEKYQPSSIDAVNKVNKIEFIQTQKQKTGRTIRPDMTIN